MESNIMICWFFHGCNEMSETVATKLENAKEATEKRGYKVVTIFNRGEPPELHIDSCVYPYRDHWIDLFISECEKSFAIAR